MHPWLSRLTLVLVFSATAFAGEAPDQATEALAGVRAYRQAHAHQDQLPSRFLAALGMTKGESVSAAGLLPAPASGRQAGRGLSACRRQAPQNDRGDCCSTC